MNTDLFCPECESTHFAKEIIRDDELNYEYSIDVCLVCNEKGEFSSELMNENHEKYYSALGKAHRVDLKKIVDELSSKNYSLAYLETAFGLPQSTISKWQNGGFSHEGYVLMKIIQSFPWIVSVAEQKFSQESIRGGSISQLFSIIAGSPLTAPDITGESLSVSIRVKVEERETAIQKK